MGNKDNTVLIDGVMFVEKSFHISEYESAMEYGFEQGKAKGYARGYNKGFEDGGIVKERNLKEVTNNLEQAFDEGYDQAIDDLIEAGVIGESNEGYSEDDYSECGFGEEEDDEDEEYYCFFKEIERVLNTKFELNTKSEDVERKHSHYFKDVRHLDYIDIYQVCKLFEVEDPSHCTQHSIKKLLMSGKRGVKDKMKDIIEARDTLNRYLQIEGIE